MAMDRTWAGFAKPKRSPKPKLSKGATMITLDCSDFLDNAAGALPDEELEARQAVDETLRKRYLDRLFELGPRTVLSYDLPGLRRIAAVYGRKLSLYPKYWAMSWCAWTSSRRTSGSPM